MMVLVVEGMLQVTKNWQNSPIDCPAHADRTQGSCNGTPSAVEASHASLHACTSAAPEPSVRVPRTKAKTWMLVWTSRALRVFVDGLSASLSLDRKGR